MAKYGLLYYKDTDNIGDDIQSYAASRFLPQIDYLIDRENILGFIPNNNEKVKVIMNAWYVHNKYLFGISPFIYPLFISMHFKNFPYVDGITLGSKYINPSTMEMLNRYGPVGARDYQTCELLSDLKIENYFSGCLTLTIEKFKNVKKDNYICAVNLSPEELDILKHKTNKKIIEINQDIEYGSLSNLTWEERKNNVQKLLKIYQQAELVVTTKLHCALPCLALETNVLVLYDEKFDSRMKTFKEYFNYVPREDFINVDITKIKNSDKYLKLRNQLIKSCEKFIATDDDLNSDMDLATYQKMYTIINEKVSLMDDNIENLGLLYREECHKSDVILKENENYKIKLKNLENDNIYLKNKLNDIFNSKAWKFVTTFRNIINMPKKLKLDNCIKINEVTTDKNKLYIKYEVSGKVKRFFEEKQLLEIEYDFNLDDISKSILVIPFLTLFLPVAWITKTDIIVDEIDEDFYNSLEKIRSGLNEMYNNEFKKIKIKYGKLVKNENHQKHSSLFFSGGVDSLNTLVNNFNKNPYLVMIWGSDIWLEDINGWKTALNNIEDIAKKFDKKMLLIKSNFRKNINELELNRVYEKTLGDNWWHGVEHGLALLGHIAPISQKYDIKTHYMPGTFTDKDQNVKCGSYPTIDESFKVSSTDISHDGFNYSRLDKVKNIVKFIKKKNVQINFRTCYHERESLINCCNCEKCFRTIMELVAIGENPNNYGYEYNQDIILKIKDFLAKKEFEHEICRSFWLDIQNELKKGKYYNEFDINWLKSIKF